MKPLKVGDRIQLRSANSVPRFHVGDTGTVMRGPMVRAGRQPYYLVAKDIGDVTTTTILDANKIESDA